MKIDVARLKEGVEESFQESLVPSELDLDTSEVRHKGDINISTRVRKDMQVVSAQTHFSVTAEFTCSRCLKEFEQVVVKDINSQYPLDKASQFIDITQDIRQEIILGYPVKFLCKVDCRGLCHHCGQDLNNGECKCRDQRSYYGTT